MQGRDLVEHSTKTIMQLCILAGVECKAVCIEADSKCDIWVYSSRLQWPHALCRACWQYSAVWPPHTWTGNPPCQLHCPLECPSCVWGHWQVHWQDFFIEMIFFTDWVMVSTVQEVFCYLSCCWSPQGCHQRSDFQRSNKVFQRSSAASWPKRRNIMIVMENCMSMQFQQSVMV